MRLIAPVLCGAAHHTSQQKTASNLKFQGFLLHPTSQTPNTCTTLDCSSSSPLTSRIVPLSFFLLTGLQTTTLYALCRYLVQLSLLFIQQFVQELGRMLVDSGVVCFIRRKESTAAQEEAEVEKEELEGKKRKSERAVRQWWIASTLEQLARTEAVESSEQQKDSATHEDDSVTHVFQSLQLRLALCL